MQKKAKQALIEINHLNLDILDIRRNLWDRPSIVVEILQNSDNPKATELLIRGLEGFWATAWNVEEIEKYDYKDIVNILVDRADPNTNDLIVKLLKGWDWRSLGFNVKSHLETFDKIGTAEAFIQAHRTTNDDYLRKRLEYILDDRLPNYRFIRLKRMWQRLWKKK